MCVRKVYDLHMTTNNTCDRPTYELIEIATFTGHDTYEHTMDALNAARRELVRRGQVVPVVTNTELVHRGAIKGGRWVLDCSSRVRSFVSPVNPGTAITCAKCNG